MLHLQVVHFSTGLDNPFIVIGSSKGSWRHPLTVAVAAGVFGVSGSIGAAVIISSNDRGSDDAARTNGSAQTDGFRATIASVNSVRSARGDSVLVTVRGTAGPDRVVDGELEAVFVVARLDPSDGPAVTPNTQHWTARKARFVDLDGRWITRLRLEQPRGRAITVFAAVVKDWQICSSVNVEEKILHDLARLGPNGRTVLARSLPQRLPSSEDDGS